MLKRSFGQIKIRVKSNSVEQIFSNSVANGFQFYSRYYPEALRGYEETAKFCKKINNMFDALNRKIPNQGLVPDNDDFKVYNWIQYLCYSTFQ